MSFLFQALLLDSAKWAENLTSLFWEVPTPLPQGSLVPRRIFIGLGTLKSYCECGCRKAINDWKSHGLWLTCPWFLSTRLPWAGVLTARPCLHISAKLSTCIFQHSILWGQNNCTLYWTHFPRVYCSLYIHYYSVSLFFLLLIQRNPFNSKGKPLPLYIHLPQKHTPPPLFSFSDISRASSLLGPQILPAIE